MDSETGQSDVYTDSLDPESFQLRISKQTILFNVFVYLELQRLLSFPFSSLSSLSVMLHAFPSTYDLWHLENHRIARVSEIIYNFAQRNSC
jgi:hypothetical protein